MIFERGAAYHPWNQYQILSRAPDCTATISPDHQANIRHHRCPVVPLLAISDAVSFLAKVEARQADIENGSALGWTKTDG